MRQTEWRSHEIICLCGLRRRRRLQLFFITKGNVFCRWRNQKEKERESESGDSAGWVLEREKRRSGQRSGGSILPGDLEAEERCLSRSYRQRAACFSAASVCVCVYQSNSLGISINAGGTTTTAAPYKKVERAHTCGLTNYPGGKNNWRLVLQSFDMRRARKKRPHKMVDFILQARRLYK